MEEKETIVPYTEATTKSNSSNETKLWTEMDLFLQTDSIQAMQGKKEYCGLFRGSENWLARVTSNTDQKELAKSIRQEVRALFAKLLRMENVSILLGAGASYYAAGFVGSGLYQRVKALMPEKSNQTLEAVLEKTSNPDQIGQRFEDFLSQLAAWQVLADSAKWPLDRLSLDVELSSAQGPAESKQSIDALMLDFERAVTVVCNASLPQSPFSDRSAIGCGSFPSITPHEALLSKLVARDPHEGRARIFTTNYDTLVEQAMDRLGILYSDGFSGTINRRFNPTSYDIDYYYPGQVTEGAVQRYDKVLQLYKLHGSVNWRRKLQPSISRPYGISFTASGIPSESDILADTEEKKLLEKTFNQNEGLAILPTMSKYCETLAMPFAHLFRSFGEALREPQTVLLIIGYSGWDLHINQIVEDALANPGFTCVIVDPIPSEWARRLCEADACGRVYCLCGPWGTFEFFAVNVLPDLEILKTDLSIARTLRDLAVTRTEDLPSDSERKADADEQQAATTE